MTWALLGALLAAGGLVAYLIYDGRSQRSSNTTTWNALITESKLRVAAELKAGALESSVMEIARARDVALGEKKAAEATAARAVMQMQAAQSALVKQGEEMANRAHDAALDNPAPVLRDVFGRNLSPNAAAAVSGAGGASATAVHPATAPHGDSAAGVPES